jgi:hypothetical protein
MKRLILLVLVGVVGWTGFWFVRAQSLRGSVEDWFEARRDDGWTAEYSALRVRGFPYRLDLTVEDIDLNDPERGTGWQAPFFQVLSLSYKPNHVILVFPDEQVLTLPEAVHEITSEGLKASLVTEGDDEVERFNLEADVLNVTREGTDVALAGLRLAFERPGEEDDLYRLGIVAQDMASPQTPVTDGSTAGLTVQAEIGFDRPWTVRSVEDTRPQPRQIDLTMIDYQVDDLQLNLAGALEVDAKGQPYGELVLRAVNWKTLLEQARRSGEIPEGFARTLEQGLTLAAGLSGRKDTLDLPLRFEGKTVSLGVIPLGSAPRLRIP